MAWLAKVAGGVMQYEGAQREAEGADIAGDSAVRTGRAQRQMAEFQAAQLEQNAGQHVAASQRDALEIQRQSDLAASRALALSAAGGGGASDVGVVNLLAQFQSETALRKATALYQGEDVAQKMRAQAGAARYQGFMEEQLGIDKKAAYKKKAAAIRIGAVASLFGAGASAMNTKYNTGGGNSGGGMDE